MPDKKEAPEGTKSKVSKKKKAAITTLIVVLILGSAFSFHSTRLWVCEIGINLLSTNTFCVAITVIPIRYDPKIYYDAIKGKEAKYYGLESEHLNEWKEHLEQEKF